MSAVKKVVVGILPELLKPEVHAGSWKVLLHSNCTVLYR